MLSQWALVEILFKEGLILHHMIQKESFEEHFMFLEKNFN